MAHQLSKPQPKETLKIDELPETADAIKRPRPKTGRRGFLPIKTNTFDRVFISVVSFVAIHLLWMRFLEFYLPLWVATILSLILAVILVRRG
jgi:predicted small integral membrane protein